MEPDDTLPVFEENNADPMHPEPMAAENPDSFTPEDTGLPTDFSMGGAATQASMADQVWNDLPAGDDLAASEADTTLGADPFEDVNVPTDITAQTDGTLDTFSLPEASEFPSGHTVTYEDAMAAIDRMEQSPSTEVDPSNASDPLASLGAESSADPYAGGGLTYEQAMAELDRLEQHGASSTPFDNLDFSAPPDEQPSSNPEDATALSDDPTNLVDEDSSSGPVATDGVSEDPLPAATDDSSPIVDQGTSQPQDDPPTDASSNGELGAAASAAAAADAPADASASDSSTDGSAAGSDLSPDTNGYATHLHELGGDQLVDEAFHQDQPALREAAAEELKARLQHSDTPASPQNDVAPTNDAVPSEPNPATSTNS